MTEAKQISKADIRAALDTFYLKYHGVRLMNYPEMLVYRVGLGNVKKCVAEANELIKLWELPLIAKSGKNAGILFDSFTVTAK